VLAEEPVIEKVSQSNCSRARLSDAEIDKIVTLLKTTDMTLAEIGTRMQCSRSAVASINRRFQARAYQGLRSRWTVVLCAQKVAADKDEAVVTEPVLR
jgi:hypothetical protein